MLGMATIIFNFSRLIQNINIKMIRIIRIIDIIVLLKMIHIYLALSESGSCFSSDIPNINIISKMNSKNVLGTALKMCCDSPITGFYRDGFCKTGPYDYGKHLVCAQVTQQFLQFSKQRGNDLTKASPEYGFPGLSPGDKWCLCAMRWLQAHQAGVAPKIDLEASHEKLLEYISLSELQNYQIAHPS